MIRTWAIHNFISLVALTSVPSPIHTSLSDKWFAAFLDLSCPQYAPWGLSFQNLLRYASKEFQLSFPDSFCYHFLWLPCCLLALSMEFPITFFRTRFLLPPVFSWSVGRVSRIHYYMRMDMISIWHSLFLMKYFHFSLSCLAFGMPPSLVGE